MHITEERSLKTGALIVNADDWGRDRENTDRILDCAKNTTVSSVSAMVFMADSDRASVLARDYGIDTGLHINFTSPFSARLCNPQLREHQGRVAKYLTRHRLAKVLFHPGLTKSFDYVLESQTEEYERLYGVQPIRLDGHHHMHLCANVLFGDLLPPDAIVRRNFSFQPREKGVINRTYRQMLDRFLQRKYRTTDYFFSLEVLACRDHLDHALQLAHEHFVEIETHPVNHKEYHFLMGGKFSRRMQDLPIAPHYMARSFNARTG